MCWDEIDSDRVWTLPARRSKTKVDVPRPLSKAAQAILEARPRFEGCPYVFTTDGLGPITNFSGGKAAFDLACGVTGWRLHDLRRTARSLLSRAGISPDVAERCLGHVIGGVRGTYDRHKYYGEKKLAFEKLATLIESIVNPKENVLPMKGKEQRT